MKFIDTHSHVYLPDFDVDRKELQERMKAAGLLQVLLPNIDESSLQPMLQLCAEDPDVYRPMIGLHPCSIEANFQTVLDLFEQKLSKGVFCGVGEIGLDYYWDLKYLSEQKHALRRQLNWAKDLDLAVSIHCRNPKTTTDLNAYTDMIGILKQEQDGRLKGVLHCFGGTESEALQLIDLGFHLGVGGVITYRKSGLDQVLAAIDLRHLVLETDAPYLAPVPNRGKRNEPSYLPIIAAALAQAKNCTIEEVAEVCTAEAQKLFRIL